MASPMATATVDNQLEGSLKNTLINMIATTITGIAQNASQIFVWITGNSVNIESVLFY
jgi:post-segregation antitoxin (ccd killing protein)